MTGLRGRLTRLTRLAAAVPVPDSAAAEDAWVRALTDDELAAELAVSRARIAEIDAELAGQPLPPVSAAEAAELRAMSDAELDRRIAELRGQTP